MPTVHYERAICRAPHLGQARDAHRCNSSIITCTHHVNGTRCAPIPARCHLRSIVSVLGICNVQSHSGVVVSWHECSGNRRLIALLEIGPRVKEA